MILRRSVQILKLQIGVLRRLRQIADEQSHDFRSEGFTRFFAMLREELADDYLETLAHHLSELEFKRGLLETAELGKGNKARRYIVRRAREQSWMERLSFGKRSSSYSFTIPARDENGFRALEEIRGKGINHVANAVAQSADHVKSFFSMLRLELAFYLGCLNLRTRLDEKDEPTCFPIAVGPGQLRLAADGIYDVCLTLHLEERVVGNEVNADGKSLIMITGANQGGKSTLLRSLGLAHLMMQSGMFVGAQSFRANVCAGLFAHYKREEDVTMESGKLDEELSRMSEIADAITPNCVLLCNESFASTNEREGSEIARQVVRAMLDKQIKVFFVTHMYDLAHGLHAERLDTALFLRAERQPDGRRTFKLLEGEPLPTSYGEDSYRRIFGTAPDAASAEVAELGR
jgi:DNA mismatch repair ATPase MutS